MLSYIYQTFTGNNGNIEKNSTSNSQLYPEPEVSIPEEYLKKLEKFKNYSTLSYDSTNLKHEKLLLKLWKNSCPNISLENRISQQWKLIGFQGKDPASDFRGVGIFGLWNLIYFTEKYNKKYIELLQKTQKKRRFLSFCYCWFKYFNDVI